MPVLGPTNEQLANYTKMSPTQALKDDLRVWLADVSFIRGVRYNELPLETQNSLVDDAAAACTGLFNLGIGCLGLTSELVHKSEDEVVKIDTFNFDKTRHFTPTFTFLVMP